MKLEVNNCKLMYLANHLGQQLACLLTFVPAILLSIFIVNNKKNGEKYFLRAGVGDGGDGIISSDI